MRKFRKFRKNIDWEGNVDPVDYTFVGGTLGTSDVVRIPIRIHRGQYPQFNESDITLQDGDVVFIEARETEYFYSGGLLGGGQYILPRDYDLDLVEALSIIEGEARAARPTLAIGGPSIMNQDVTVGASQVIIHRKRADGRRLAIKVDLFDALNSPNCPILIQPEDRIYLRYTCPEAVMAYFERMLLPQAASGVASAIAFQQQ